LTLGVTNPDGSLRTRLEIDMFVKNVAMTNLYLLALRELKRQVFLFPDCR
jgi:hypothetical protein